MDLFSLISRGVMLAAAMTAAAPSHALGLGDLTVSSYLGQPLNARIALLGSPAELDAGCFHVAPVHGAALPLPADIRVKLDQSGNRAGLLIETRQIINEPVLMVAVSAACPERVQRDYAVLLDPPGFRQELPVVSTEPAARPIRPPASAGADRLKESRKARISAPDLEQKKKARAPRQAPRQSARLPENNGPRLILTGSRRLFSPPLAQLALHMDVALLDATRRAEVPLTADEITDENTALTRKVAHLEEVLANLQERNAQLQQARTQTSPQKSGIQAHQPAVPANRSTWPYFLLGLVLLTGGTAYVIYRRRRETTSEFDEADIWRMPAPAAAPPKSGNKAKEEGEGKEADEGSTSEVDFAPMTSIIASGQGDGTEVKDSVADEVEVFVAHGHSDLAIHMLEDHVEKTPEESPVPWLLLLDLLRRDGAEAKYEEYRRKCKLHFNVAMPAFGEIELNLGDEGLESYSHITSELVRLWPTDQVTGYLDDLIYDRRGGSRMGFDPTTYRDIVLLRSIRLG